MLPLAGQTAGPIGLKFFVDTHGAPPPMSVYKKLKLPKRSLLDKNSTIRVKIKERTIFQHFLEQLKIYL